MGSTPFSSSLCTTRKKMHWQDTPSNSLLLPLGFYTGRAYISIIQKMISLQSSFFFFSRNKKKRKIHSHAMAEQSLCRDLAPPLEKDEDVYGT
jgi:hypothetical protein